MRLSIYGTTDVGRQREHNEDSLLIIYSDGNGWVEATNLETNLTDKSGVVCVVADGMGGANAGEVASEIAITTVRETIGKLISVPSVPQEVEKMLASIIQDGHNRIIKASKRSGSLIGMGTTIVIACFFGDNIYVSWSGDSRCYIYNKENSIELLPFTDDHSLVWERVKSKEISPEEARLSDDSNLILQSLGGASQKPDPEFRWAKLNKNDRILLCSDGLNSMLSNIGIQQILDYNSTPGETCESLIQAANNAGGRDNITAIIVDVSENEKAPVVTVVKETPSAIIVPIKPRKRRLYFFSVLFVLILIITASIFYRTDVVKFFHSVFKAADTTTFNLNQGYQE
ncbi:serine/threonine-protein phosphatase, partial [bacterium]|nr:serine/threonine-protein phosphatase [bacterium]